MTDRIVLDADLLEVEPHAQAAPADFAACLNVRGLYNSNQFVLRLSPRIHELINAATTGVYAAGELDGETIQAYSTYLHETVHWWQHMGSTSGLILSLARPAQAHINAEFLETVLQAVGGHKSLLRWAEVQARKGVAVADPALRAANQAVNNAIDAEFFKAIVTNPHFTAKCQEDRYFESVGHCFWMAYGQAVSLLASTVDPESRHLPGGPAWNDGFVRVRDAGVEGFVYQGQVRVAPLGLHALYEGQARMVQLQYLTCGRSNPPTFAELRAGGYLKDVYGQAFDAFLTTTGAAEPAHVDDPLVALFLLVVDLAINPTRGFPLEIEEFENFILDADPGIRFLRLSQAVRDRPELLTRITGYTRDEYLAVSEILTGACAYDPPLEALKQVDRWAALAPGVVQIMRERETFEFDRANLVVRVLFSHFVAFCQDKLARPEFFCWPGAWMVGDRVSDESQALFLRHLSLYSDQAEDDGIYPRNRPDVDPDNLVETLNTFYSNIVLYDLTRQWIVQDGPFEFNFRWLSQSHAAEDMTAWAKKLFEHVYGAGPDAFDLLPT